MNIVGVIVFSENGLPESICSSGCEKNFTVHAACGVMIDEFLGEIPRVIEDGGKGGLCPMDRTVLLEGPEVSLEDRALIVSEFRYLLSEIKSVEVLRVEKAATGPILLIATGIICLLAVSGEGGLRGALAGVGMIVGAVAWWALKKPNFHVLLSMEDGQATPFESQDERIASKVLKAINDARATADRGD